jgi:hypothetical protein
MFSSARIEVLIRPDEIRLARRSALSRQRATVVRCQPVASLASDTPAEGTAGAAAPRWRGSIDALGEALAQQRRGTQLQVVVSDHFLRYILVPWNDKLVADSERLAFAQHGFASTYGSLAEQWALSMDEQIAGRASIACAIDRDLLQALKDTAAEHGARLRAVRTALAERINRHRRALTDSTFCLASVEPGRLTLAFHNETGWAAVRSRRTGEGLAELLPGILRQEAAAAGATEGGTLYIVGEGVDELALHELEGWNTVLINEPAPVEAEPEAAAPAEAAAE